MEDTLTKPGASGLSFKKVEGEVAPPLAGGPPGAPPTDGQAPAAAATPGEQPPASGPAAQAIEVGKTGKIPLHPAVIRLPASILGRIGTELTGYPGFTFTEQELNDLSALWMQTGIQMNPMTQAAIGTTSMIAGKFGGYLVWKRMGSPPVKGADSIGKEKGPEEVKTDAAAK